jgi:peptidoglycan/LPS O-acetylase OafA/YrhL
MTQPRAHDAVTTEGTQVRQERHAPRERVIFRADIQALRAVAVLLVVGFHLWPAQLTGGYVGVDVFFVISGFLITSHLLQRSFSRPADVLDFWARRRRRLLPASVLVIIVTVLVGTVVLPATQLLALGRDALASTFYFVNWLLASSAVDYLGAQDAPSPLQHFWSLSVEEQFYFVWPILIGVTLWLSSRRARSTTRSVVWVLSCFVAVFLVVSIYWTAVEPASAYFVTPTRLWELGLGGLIGAVALSTRASSAEEAPTSRHLDIRAIAAWVGLLLILLSAFLYTAETPFPGIAAVVPVFGSALFLAADSNGGRLSPSRFLGSRPIQHIGDVSYSLYLWHWPLIVLMPYVIGAPLSLPSKLVIIAASIILASLTKTLVEDPTRNWSWFRGPRRRTFLLAGGAMLIAALVSLAPAIQVSALLAREAEQNANAEVDNRGCFGAAALANDECTLRGTGIVPSPANALGDKSDAYDDDCFSFPPFNRVQRCFYGDESASTSIALVGNSHAGQWLPAMQSVAANTDAKVTTFLGSRCRPTTTMIVFDTQADSEGCSVWGTQVVDLTSQGDFDLIVLSIASIGDIEGVAAEDTFDAVVEGYMSPLREWIASGTPVLIIRDTPIPGVNIPDCVAVNADDFAACDGSRPVWEQPDPLVVAAEQLSSPRITIADFNDSFCDASTCYSVIGGVLVYFDKTHVTATFIDSLSDALTEEIDGVIQANR